MEIVGSNPSRAAFIPNNNNTKKGSSMGDNFTNRASYTDGFVDGQTDILDEILDIRDSGDHDWIEQVIDFVELKKKEIDSL